ncbi:unnamed protein product, partial [Brassica rapa]
LRDSYSLRNAAVRPVTTRRNQRRRPQILILARGRSRAVFIDLLQRSYVHKKRNRRMREKQELLRGVNAFAANMFTATAGSSYAQLLIVLASSVTRMFFVKKLEGNIC